MPIIKTILSWKKEGTETLLIGVNGAQGTGKTTFSHFVCEYLSQQYEFRTIVLSLDDFYKTKSERNALAEAIHPLFATRGVPGTHAIDLALNVIQACTLKNAHDIIESPIFRKEIDDRAERSQWQRIQTPIDILLFEGWCVSARPQAIKDLEIPINQLEAKDDPNGVWRSEVNGFLAGSYSDLFALLDRTIMLKAPSFNQILEWRMEQENKLRIQSKSLADASQHHYMSTNELKHFIAHYERLTKWMLNDMPTHADIILEFNKNRLLKQLVSKYV